MKMHHLSTLWPSIPKRRSSISKSEAFWCFIPIHRQQSKGLLLWCKKLIFLVYFSDKYVSDAQNLHEHVMRHNHGTDENGSSINCLKIVFDTEYPF